MPLALQTLTQLVNNQASAILAHSTSLVDFSDGSVTKALIEANAGNALWLQGLIVGLLASTRLTTSSGVEVDTFVGDFGLTREPAVASNGLVIFSRSTPSVIGIIPAYSQVFAPSYNVTFLVQPNADDPYWHELLQQYQIPIGITSSNSIPVTASTTGLITNVPENAINTLQSIYIGMDYVNNPAPTVDGSDQESDDALKIRFVNYLNGLSKATKQAIAAAVLSVPGVKRYNLIENKDTDLTTTRLGFFTAVIDDDTGVPSDNLRDSVEVAVEAVRGLTIAFQVIKPIVINVDIVAHIITDLTIDSTTVHDEVVTALENYLISLPVAPAVLSYTKLIEIMYNADPTILNITGYTLNGGTSDLTPASQADVYIKQTFTIDVNS